jgi:hypothetical protein
VASLKTRTIRDRDEMVAYFNQLAVAYAEAHSPGFAGFEKRGLFVLLTPNGRYC